MGSAVNKWIKKARKCAQNHAARSGLIGKVPEDQTAEMSRVALTQLHHLMLNAPLPVAVEYDSLQEEDLDHPEATASIIKGHYGWTVSDVTSNKAWAQAIGIQIRALDHFLYTFCDSFFAYDDPKIYLCNATRNYVIPCKKLIKRHVNQCYARRGLIFHRILPKKLPCGSTVVLKFSEQWVRKALGSPIEFIMGAALFRDTDYRVDVRENSRFRMIGIEYVRPGGNMPPEAQIIKQINASLDHHCFGIVWPELTVPPNLRMHIANYLQSGLRGEIRERPAIVVSGSWHEARDGKMVNISQVYDGYGRERLEFKKFNRFEGKIKFKLCNVIIDNAVEDIDVENELLVLATPDALIAFGLCKDFCCESHPKKHPYHDLDVDLVVIPSLGNRRTIFGHRHTAETIRTLFGTLSFVVQQGLNGEPEPPALGYVLGMLDRPEEAIPEKIVQREIWERYPPVRDGVNGQPDPAK